MSGGHVTDRLSDYLDGTLQGAAQDRVAGHLAECATCRGVLRDLEAVVTRAGALAPVEPPAEVWEGIHAAISRAGPPLRLEAGGADTTTPRRRGVSVPQAAAAAIALSLLSAAAAWQIASGPGVEGPVAAEQESATATETARLVADVVPEELSQELQVLEQALVTASADLDENTRRILQRNLSIIDRAIQESLEALAAAPADPYLEGHLEAQLRRKVRVLRSATGLSSAD